MVALCLDEEEVPNYHEDDQYEAQKLVDEMDDDSTFNELYQMTRTICVRR